MLLKSCYRGGFLRPFYCPFKGLRNLPKRNISCRVISRLICIFGHKTITKYRSQFSSADEHDEAIFTMLESFPKRTLMHILGDFLFDGPQLNYYILRLSNLPYKIKLVLGNHDSRLLYTRCPSNIEIQLPFYSYKNMWVSHCPIHPQELRSRILNVHGHLHGGIVQHCNGEPDERYFNVNLDNNDFKPVPLETIISHFKGN